MLTSGSEVEIDDVTFTGAAGPNSLRMGEYLNCRPQVVSQAKLFSTGCHLFGEPEIAFERKRGTNGGDMNRAIAAAA
ncbi:hypothetical protein [Rhizobium azibense]|uniref:hypothetical protein n=1 Tax=Rhizobium azibense TaxID=1136135 RepID=UPI0010444ABF|nr:hypothetical protein [Rhizobium azibense]